MKIVHIITTLDRGGAEIQLLTLVREQIRKGLHVHVLYLKGQSELRREFEFAGVSVQDLRSLSIMQLIRYFRNSFKSDTDIFHAHLPRAELLCAFLVRRNRFLITRHNAEPFFPAAPRFLSILLSRYVCFKSFGLIAISSAVRDFLISSHEVSRRHPIRVIKYAYSFQTDESYRVERNQNKAKHDLAKQFCIVTIGRLVPQKDYPTLLHAIQIASQHLPQLRLRIVGVGPLEKDLKTLANKLNISNNIEWLGKQSDVKKVLVSADMFLLTSKYEGFGLALLEAVSVGVPIVSTRFSAVSEVLGKNYPGLVPIGDAMEIAKQIQALFSPSYSAILQNCLSEIRNDFLVEVMESAIMAFYLSLLGRE